MRKLVSIQKIKALWPIPGADLIEVAQVLGWEVVVKKGEFNEGDLCVYGEIDSIFPADNPNFTFLEGKRLKTKKIRRQVSQGIVFSITILPDGDYSEGDEVTELLQVTKYEFDLIEKAAYQNSNLIPFPDWISKTDEERIQTRLELLSPEFQQLYGSCYATEKLDGTSSTYYFNRFQEQHPFGVCTRSREIIQPDESAYWAIAQRYQLNEILPVIAEVEQANQIVLQGEIIGPAIQGNKYKLDQIDFYAFNLIIDGKKLTTAEIAAMLDRYQIKTVPVVIENFNLLASIKEFVQLSIGNSVIAAKVKREGIVIRNTHQTLSFKVINPEFLLKYDA